MHGNLSEFACRHSCSHGGSARAPDATSLHGPRPFPLPGTPTRWSRDREFDVRHVKLEVKLDPKRKTVRGRVTHTVRPFLSGLESATFDCAELDVTRVTVGGKTATFRVRDRKLTVTLPTAPKRGRDLRIAITYSGTPRRGLYFCGPDEHRPDTRVEMWTQGQDEDSHHWFPCFDYPNEKQTTEIVATVPAGLKVLSNGKLLKQSSDKSKTWDTWHWRLDEPHVIYLVTLVVGDFHIHEETWRGIPVTFWGPQERATDVRQTLKNTSKMLTLFSRTTGVNYAYPQYAQVFVQDFIFGGMENTSATTLTDTAIVGATARREVYMDGLVAHELAHQWFGDLVTCRDWSHGWLNEGFATFLETVWKRHDEGEDEAAYYRMGDQGEYLSEDGGHYRRPIVCNVYNDPIEIFDRHLYQKGGAVLHMLERELGRELFWECIKTYLNRHAGGSVVTDDLRRAIEDVSGRNMDWFFDQWVLHGGHPELDVSTSDKDGTVSITIEQKQDVDHMTRCFRFRVGVRVETTEGSFTQELQVRERHHSFHVPIKGEVKWVALDPLAELLHSGEFEQSDEAWVGALGGDPDAATRVRAARCLSKKGTPAGVRALRHALENDEYWFVRVEAARSLAKIKGDVAKKALIGALVQSDPRVRRAVAATLGAFRRDKAVARALTAVLGGNETSPGVRHDAAVALGRTLSDGAYETLTAQLDVDSWNDMARRGATYGLALLRDDRAIDAIVERTHWRASNGLRGAATDALRHLGLKPGPEREHVREVLEELVSDRWLRVQISAAATLGSRGDARSAAVLRAQAERDLDGRVVRSCKEAAQALAKGTNQAEDIRKLQDALAELREQNVKLRERLERLEADCKNG